jgi:hypothetical protein
MKNITLITESDTLAELVAEADALLSGTLPPLTSQGTHWAHSSFTGEERRFRKDETIPIGWSAGRAAKATGGAK